jgi:hypothetical protein
MLINVFLPDVSEEITLTGSPPADEVDRAEHDAVAVAIVQV